MLNVGYYPNLLKKPTSHQTQPSQIKKPFLNENFCGGYDLGEPEQPSQIQEDIYIYYEG